MSRARQTEIISGGNIITDTELITIGIGTIDRVLTRMKTRVEIGISGADPENAAIGRIGASVRGSDKDHLHIPARAQDLPAGPNDQLPHTVVGGPIHPRSEDEPGQALDHLIAKRDRSKMAESEKRKAGMRHGRLSLDPQKIRVMEGRRQTTELRN